MIPHKRLERLTIAVTMGIDPEPQNDEERSYVESIREEITTARQSGKLVEVYIPHDWPDVDEDDDISQSTAEESISELIDENWGNLSADKQKQIRDILRSARSTEQD